MSQLRLAEGRLERLVTRCGTAAGCGQGVTASGRRHNQPCSTMNQPRLAKGCLECLVAIIIIISSYIIGIYKHTHNSVFTRCGTDGHLVPDVILETGDILNSHLAHQQAAVTNKELGDSLGDSSTGCYGSPCCWPCSTARPSPSSVTTVSLPSR